MKHSLFAVAALATTFAAGACAPAMAQTHEPSAPSPASSTAAPTGARKIAVIAFQPAVASTNEGRAAIRKVQEKFAPQQAQLKTQNDQITALKKQLQDSGKTLTADQRADKLRTIDDKEKSLQRQAQEDQQDYQQQLQEVFQGLEQKFYAVMQSYATQHGYGLVLDMSSRQTPVVWASKEADITRAVVDEYNRKAGVEAPTPHTTHHSTASH